MQASARGGTCLHSEAGFLRHHVSLLAPTDSSDSSVCSASCRVYDMNSKDVDCNCFRLTWIGPEWKSACCLRIIPSRKTGRESTSSESTSPCKCRPPQLLCRQTSRSLSPCYIPTATTTPDLHSKAQANFLHPAGDTAMLARCAKMFFQRCHGWCQTLAAQV